MQVPPLQATVCSLTDGLLPSSHGSEEAALLLLLRHLVFRLKGHGSLHESSTGLGSGADACLIRRQISSSLWVQARGMRRKLSFMAIAPCGSPSENQG